MGPIGRNDASPHLCLQSKIHGKYIFWQSLLGKFSKHSHESRSLSSNCVVIVRHFTMLYCLTMAEIFRAFFPFPLQPSIVSRVTNVTWVGHICSASERNSGS